MKLLIDTCTFLWLAGNDRRLSETARNACRNRSNTIYLSALSVLGDCDQASPWPTASARERTELRRALHPGQAALLFIRQRQALELEQLGFDEACAIHEGSLPAHHADPFDRGLVCQAVHHGTPIVTPDPLISRYAAPTLR